jgi:hypothetical protein
MKTNLFLAVLMLTCLGLRAQTKIKEYENYEWEKDPHPHTLTAAETKESDLILKDYKIIEYAYNEKGELNTFVTVHMIIKLNTDKSIEENNKIYIPLHDVISFIDLKARTISKTGKITILDKSNVKDVANFENSGPFKIFAVEGAELGSEIEYIYSLKKTSSYFGSEKVQYTTPRKNFRIDLISPENLTFETKCYNKFPDFVKDSSLTGKIRLIGKADYIPGMKEEKYSAYDADRMRVEYKLSYNLAKPGKRLLTWNDAGESYFTSTNVITPKAKSKVHDLLKQIDVNKLSTEEKVRKIERYVKTKISLSTETGEDFYDVERIIKNKYGNATGLVKLYTALFADAGVESQVVLTCDRISKKFDGSFDSWNYLSEYLIYFPEISNFIAPDQLMMRLGFVPYGLTYTDGLFIKKVSIGDYETGVAKIKNIPATDYTLSYNRLYEDVSLESDFSGINMHIKQAYTGYEAQSYQPVYGYLPDEDKKKLSEALLKILGNEATVTNIKVSNVDEKSILVEPFIVEGDLKSSAPLEKAGNKYLFKIGTLIGPQAELYQEDERKTDVENSFNHGYYREITFTIPDGYKVANTEALNIDVFDLENNERTMEFKSSFTISGNKLKIIIDEDYRKITYPLAKFEAFRKVINASADFNKIVLILEKK